MTGEFVLVCNPHEPYFHLWPSPLYNIFPRYVIIGTNLKNNYWIEKSCFFIFSTTFVWNIFHFKKKWERYEQKIYWSTCKVLSDSNKTWIFSTDFRKILKYQISWKSVQWEPSCSMRTDVSKLIVTFRNFAKALTNQGKRHGLGLQPELDRWDIHTYFVILCCIMFCTYTTSCLLNCITETIQVTKGRKYFPQGPHVVQPWCSAFHLTEPFVRTTDHVRSLQ